MGGRKSGHVEMESYVHWGFEMIFREEGDFLLAVGHWAVGREEACCRMRVRLGVEEIRLVIC